MLSFSPVQSVELSGKLWRIKIKARMHIEPRLNMVQFYANRIEICLIQFPTGIKFNSTYQLFSVSQSV